MCQVIWLSCQGYEGLAGEGVVLMDIWLAPALKESIFFFRNQFLIIVPEKVGNNSFPETDFHHIGRC